MGQTRVDSEAASQALRNEGRDVVNAIISLTSSSSSSSSSFSSFSTLRPAEGGPQGGMRGKGNEGMEPGDMKMTGVEGSGKKVNGRRERDRDIERREAKAKTQGVRVPAETALEDRAPAEKRGRQPKGSEKSDIEGRAEIKGLARLEKATPDAKVQKFSIATPESHMQIDIPGPIKQQQQQQQQSFSLPRVSPISPRGEAGSDTMIRQGSLPQRAPDDNGAGVSRMPGGVRRGRVERAGARKERKGRAQLLLFVPSSWLRFIALSLFPSSSLRGKKQKKGRGFRWDTPPNKRHSTAGEMEEEKEEGEVVEGGYVYSVKEGGMVLAGTKKTPEEQKKCTGKKKEGEKEMTFSRSRGRSSQGTDLPPPLPPRPLSQAREMVRGRERGEGGGNRRRQESAGESHDQKDRGQKRMNDRRKGTNIKPSNPQHFISPSSSPPPLPPSPASAAFFFSSPSPGPDVGKNKGENG
uniref:Uncharacterized protein n=1 Tax=Chromera velia CCMP2878 TaxID=1169474 RepID=A0A0G4FA44_9ALVE|eukprot:Cvel_15962.t1-p1 / transcript=Cvel_15962.t1 / gene=Cvel_15962 / organism=Chromera_velia_CCMP2878 / gene_product=hypothetical protein / transcript_product=hypothetical protein / location=Cvel_scaffold1207:30530-32557(-) / protein_length=465 / sequence_SO=supercontig / SO=protein_coding / is_pseudo=false